MKNSVDHGGCYPPRPSASVDNILLDLQNSSYPTQPHSIIAKYTLGAKLKACAILGEFSNTACYVNPQSNRHSYDHYLC